MSVTSDINLSVLWECYQLEPFHGLRKPCDEDTITTTHDGIVLYIFHFSV